MYKSPFWLIQRGTVNQISATRIDDFVHWDYMGHAEFEFGALGKSLIRILYRFDEYKVLPTDLFSSDGKRVMVFTRDDTIPEKIVSFADRPNPRIYYDTKDPSFLEYVRINPAYPEKYRRLSFWFCIDNATDKWAISNNGDWMALFEDDVPAFLKVMDNEKKVWDAYSDRERNDFLTYAKFYD